MNNVLKSDPNIDCISSFFSFVIPMEFRYIRKHHLGKKKYWWHQEPLYPGFNTLIFPNSSEHACDSFISDNW